MVKRFANMQVSKMWEEKVQAQWVNLWCVIALLPTYYPADAAVECAISLRGGFSSSMHGIVETHVRSMCMALHSNLPPLEEWAKGQGVPRARHLPARARFDVRPRERFSQQIGVRPSVEAMMLECLQGNEALVDDYDILLFFGVLGAQLTTMAPSEKGAERHKVDVVRVVALDDTRDTQAGNPYRITFQRGMQCATSSWCAFCATPVWFVMRAFLHVHTLVRRWR